MADTYTSPAQAYPTAGVLTPLLTAGAPIVSSSLQACNQSPQPAHYRVSVAPAAAADTPAHYLRFDETLLGNESRTIVAGITLAATDALRVYSDTGTISFNLFYVTP